jgi:transposase InsO family protein
MNPRARYAKPVPTRAHWRSDLTTALTLRDRLDNCEPFIEGWASRAGITTDAVRDAIAAEVARRAGR